MKFETEYDKYGWKIGVQKNKIDGIIKIYQRNKDSKIHMIHKPMELRLSPENFNELKMLLRLLEEEVSSK